ncbi:MAG TPA: drug/metabolite exporter YedA [Gemmatimonadaceae bacterium]
MPHASAAPSRARILAAFAAVYVVWGSTYLAIRIAIDTMPPFLMAGVRFLVAGGLLYAWARSRGAPAPTRRQWITAAIVGGFLLLGGNGGVVWAEQRVASGVAALLVATVPLWVVMLEWLRGGTRPGLGTTAGVVLGLAGLAILVEPGSLLGGGRIDTLGALVLVGASLSWSIGSLYSRRHKSGDTPLLGSATQMLMGGALLVVFSLVTGDAARLDLAGVTLASMLALVYLIAFGSLVGYTAYIWLLGVVAPSRVATYAYVNPVVAVFLGWLILDEPVTSRVLLAAGVIVAAVALITTAVSGAKTRVERAPSPESEPITPAPEAERRLAS